MSIPFHSPTFKRKSHTDTHTPCSQWFNNADTQTQKAISLKDHTQYFQQNKTGLRTLKLLWMHSRFVFTGLHTFLPSIFTAFCCSLLEELQCLAQRQHQLNDWKMVKHFLLHSPSQTQLAWDLNWWPSGYLQWELGWQHRRSTLTASQMNTIRQLALRRLAMTCRVCTSQIFTLYCLTKCTYCMSSCFLKCTDRGTLAALLSLVSSFHHFTPPLRSLHTGKRPLWCLFNHTSIMSLLQILHQTKTGQWILRSD